MILNKGKHVHCENLLGCTFSVKIEKMIEMLYCDWVRQSTKTLSNNNHLQISFCQWSIALCIDRGQFQLSHHCHGPYLSIEFNLNFPITSMAIVLDLQMVMFPQGRLLTLMLLTEVIAVEYIWLINRPIKQHIITATLRNRLVKLFKVNISSYRQIKPILFLCIIC